MGLCVGASFTSSLNVVLKREHEVYVTPGYACSRSLPDHTYAKCVMAVGPMLRLHTKKVIDAV